MKPRSFVNGPLPVAVLAMLLIGMPAFAQPTQEEVRAAAAAGVQWLADNQDPAGYWPVGGGASWPVATTAFACKKLMHHAVDVDWGLGLPSPFDPANPYLDNVESCLAWLLDQGTIVAIGPQPAGNPDTDLDGLGVSFGYPGFTGYHSGIMLMVLCETVELDRVVGGSGPLAGWTYRQVAEDLADFLYWSQSEGQAWPEARGGWRYGPNWDADNSVSGWVALGLGFAEAPPPAGCGFTIPAFVKNEMWIWLQTFLQPDGCSLYSFWGPGSPWLWNNVLKQGNLLQELALVGKTTADFEVQSALSCMESYWYWPDQDPGWIGWLEPPVPGGSPGQGTNCHGTFAAMKGLQAQNVATFGAGPIDWAAEFETELVAEQNPDGSWSACIHDGDLVPVLCTSWCLLTLERAAPPPPKRFDKVLTSGPDEDLDGDIDLVVEVGKLEPTTYDFTITYHDPAGPPVLIEDTVPAEWDVWLEDDTLDCGNESASGKPGKSATKITCEEPNDGSVVVWATTRCHNKPNNQRCRPTSCGALYLNDGALAYEVDPATGEPLKDEFGDRLPPIETTDPICLAAVWDVDGDGAIEYDGTGDEDGDGLSDFDEACVLGTDPCVFNTCVGLTDVCIDADGIATAGRGLPGAGEVFAGQALTSWPTGRWTEGLDWFDNDGTCTWTPGDDLHLEDPAGACATGFRDGWHDQNATFQDCAVLDLDASFFDGQQVDVDLETGTTFTGCLGVDPLLKFYDLSGNGFWDNGEDIVLDANNNGVFD